MIIKNNVEGWEEFVGTVEDVLLNRILSNLYPVAIVNESIYLNYVGDEEKKRVFMEYYNNKKAELVVLLKEKYGISNIKGGKNLSEEKLEWLEGLVQKFEPTNINYSIIE